MALEEYQRKRDFKKTPEPSGGAITTRRKQAEPAALSFVVQKHAASRLHYDFRLELNGVLLSWAVPKGPSLDPAEKRLAVHVEDHPIDYGGFEGVIPKGQYGGGTVLLWDRGTWTPLEDADTGLQKGSLKFRLDGEKLHGNWALVRMGGKAAPKRPGDHENWLLIKETDEVAVPGGDAALVDDNPLSVATGRSMKEIAADRDRVWDSGKGEVEIESKPATAKPARKKAATVPKGAHKRAMPEVVEPQLATLAERAPEGDDWLHEIKLDGYRILAHVNHGAVRLLTRKALDWTAKFPALAKALAALPVDTAILDGELVALVADGSTSFAELQDAISRGQTGNLVYFAFDLLYRDGYDLTSATLLDRKSALAETVPVKSQGMIRYSDHQQGRGPDFLSFVCGYELEGIVSKRADRPFRGGRGTDWLKVKCLSRDEFVVIGFTEPAGQRQGLGALILGYYTPQGTLTYGGRVGTGFSDATLRQLRPQLEKLQRRTAPVSVPQGVPLKDTHWVEPKLVAEVQYSNWTADGILRHAAFQGLREDKSPEEVVYDVKPLAAGDEANHPADAEPGKTRRIGKRNAATPPAKSTIIKARDGSMTFVGLRLTHPERVLYEEQAITKLMLAEYYRAIEKWALPELGGRPLSLVRCPDGFGHPCFYQKHLSSGVPDALGRIEIPEKSGSETYLVIENLAGLIAMVQMSVLEIHPWGSTTGKVEYPDRITFDFDPDEGLPWSRVTEAAIDMREALDGIGLQSFVKTTGGKGLHVVVPIAPKLEWDAVKEFAKWVADKFVTAYPDRFTSNMAKRARTGRIFIDYLRNGRGATAIGAYSPRARAGAPVATPLFWEEVENGIAPMEFTILTVPERIAKSNSDPWEEMRKSRQPISAKVRKEVGI